VQPQNRIPSANEIGIDYLILGGGSAGCVLAARLSEDAGKTVCLIEAGRPISAASMPAAIRSRYPGRAYLDTGNIWQRLTARMSGAALPRRYEQARILGGGSAINALMANRGAPADYDEWESLGAHGWNWTTCLPYFRKLETDVDFGGELHGRSGPLRIKRTEWPRISPFVRAVLATLEQRGHPRLDDQNGPWQDGTFVGAIAVSAAGERIPTSVCYLTDAVRQRPNLTIRTGEIVDRVLFDGKKAVGALLGSGETVHAANVIVCAGAIHSPAILLRSGIGPADNLAALHIPLLADRPGVGGNLMEHPSIAVSAFLPKSARTPFPDEHHEQAIVRFSSRLGGTVEGDMHGAILSRSGWHSIGYRLGTIFFWVNKSYSRGRVTLTSANPLDEPAVDFNMLSDSRDLERLKLSHSLRCRHAGGPFNGSAPERHLSIELFAASRESSGTGSCQRDSARRVERAAGLGRALEKRFDSPAGDARCLRRRATSRRPRDDEIRHTLGRRYVAPFGNMQDGLRR
jgi:5-(hydroxymethyl)furfural/furfural oxidase